AGNARGKPYDFLPQTLAPAYKLFRGQLVYVCGGACDEIGQTIAEFDEAGVVLRCQALGHEARLEQRAPEQVRRAREIVSCAVRIGAGVDADKDNVETRLEIVGKHIKKKTLALERASVARGATFVRRRRV